MGPILGYRLHSLRSGRSPSRHNLVIFLLIATDYKAYHSKAYSLCGFENPYLKNSIVDLGGKDRGSKGKCCNSRKTCETRSGFAYIIIGAATLRALLPPPTPLRMITQRIQQLTGTALTEVGCSEPQPSDDGGDLARMAPHSRRFPQAVRR
ncbi:hypothetical protein BC826DRAFT_602519 [Russula brevipes]|nr:hypothetical protein BC826DRAFT_602519 [Russula brevipes]